MTATIEPRPTYIKALRGLGVPKKHAVKIARSYPCGTGLATATPRLLASCVGIDPDGKIPAWVGRIKAAFALSYATDGRRGSRAMESAMRTPTDIARRIRQRIAGESNECFLAVYLDARCREIETLIVHRGTLASVEVDPRDIFRPAVQVGAATVIVAHNHPSGDASPSDADIQLTRRLVEAGSLMGVAVLDHLVIAGDRTTSFASIGLMA